MIVHFTIVAFLLVIFLLVDIFLFFLDYLPTVFLYMYGFVVAMKLWCVCTFFIPTVFLVPVFPVSCAGTLVLVFNVEGFFVFSWSSWS